MTFHIEPTSSLQYGFRILEGNRRIGVGYTDEAADLDRVVAAFAAVANAAELRRHLERSVDACTVRFPEDGYTETYCIVCEMAVDNHKPECAIADAKRFLEASQ